MVMFTKKRLEAVLLATVLTAVAIPPATVSAQDLVIGTSGGAFGEALQENFFGPFTEETGVEIILVQGSTGELTSLLRAQKQSGNIEFDVTTSNNQTLISDADLYVEMDCSRIPNAAALGVEGSCEGRRVLRTIGASVLAYKTEAFPDGGPESWADFFDVKAFPGSRCLQGGSVDNHIPFLIALLADGVAPKDLYPIDFDRALTRLRTLKEHVGAYFTSFSMSQQLMRDGECVVSVMLNGRALSLRNEGFPLSISWNQALTSTGNWSIAADAPNEELAYQFLNFFMTRPKAHLAFYRTFFYGTPNAEVVDLLDGEDLEQFYAAPENISRLLPLNAQWLADNKDEVSRTYAKFLAE